MAAITKAEIVAAAFTRNVNENHIFDSDITLAVARYVTPYVNDTIDVDSDFYTNYVKPVISFGVIIDIWNRIALEVTDRGIVQMISQGAGSSDVDAKDRLKSEYRNALVDLIKIMVDNATDVNDFDYDRIGYYGAERVGTL